MAEEAAEKSRRFMYGLKPVPFKAEFSAACKAVPHKKLRGSRLPS
jgi:hypothetical protein